MKEINSEGKFNNIYVHKKQENFILDVKDTYIHRLEQEQIKLINTLRGREIKRFNVIYNEIVDKIITEEI